MIRLRRHLVAVMLGVSLGSTVLLAGGAPGDDRFKGLHLSAALERLQAHGLRILFSSDLVRPEMIVAKEPHGRRPAEILDELLVPHGLRSMPGPAGALLIVKAPPPTQVRRTPAPLRPSSPHAPPTYREQVIVNGADPAQQPATRALVSREQLLASPEPVGDALRSMERLPGVATMDGAGGLHVRGGSSRETKIVLDGLELYEPYHLKDQGGPISLIDPTAIGGMSLLGGAFPAEYGGHVGAVLEMDTIVPSADRGSEVNVGTDGLHLASQGLLWNRLRWIVAGRRGNAARLLDGLGVDRTYRPGYWDAFAKADYRVDDRTTLSLHLLGGDDNLEGANTDETITTVREPGTFRSTHTNRYAWLTLRRALSSRVLSQTVISGTRVTDDRFGSSPRVVEVNDARSLAILGVKQDWWRESARHLVKWGFELRHVHAAYAYQARPATGAFLAITEAPRGQEVGAYVADHWRVSRQLEVELGLRWDRATYTADRRGAPGPRVNAVYAVGPRTVMRIGWGLFTQSQKIHELQVEDGLDRFGRAERAEHRLVSISQDLPGGLGAEVQAYQKHLRDVAPRFENLFDPFGFFPESARDRVRVDADVARAQGLELVVHPIRRRSIGWRAAYSLSRVEDRVGERWAPRSWDRRHVVNAGVDWAPGAGWDLTFAATVQSGRPTTPVSATLVAAADGSSTIAPLFGPRNSERLPASSRADFRVGRSIAIRGSDVRASLTVTDLFDRGTSCCVTDVAFLPQPDGTVTVARHLRTGQPRLVTFGIGWRF
jgi:hypothetical protein